MLARWNHNTGHTPLTCSDGVEVGALQMKCLCFNPDGQKGATVLCCHKDTLVNLDYS